MADVVDFEVAAARGNTNHKKGRAQMGTGASAHPLAAAQAVEELLDALKEAVAMLEIYYEPNVDGSTPTITRCRAIIAKYSAYPLAAAQS